MVVVDSSIVVALLLESVNGPVHQRLEHEDVLAAPHLIDLETLSALRSLVRRGDLSAAAGTKGVEMLAAVPIDRHEHTALRPRVWSLRDNVSAYDAAYVALAELLGAPLLTTDGRLARAPGIACQIEVLPL